MNIEITQQNQAEVLADTLANGTYAIKKHGAAGELIVVRSWGGLTSLDGHYFWAHEGLYKILVRPLSQGTVIKVTL